MLMFRRTHERLMAEQLATTAAQLASAHELIGIYRGKAEQAQADHHELSRRIADFADRSLPPPRITSVQQPKSITEADTNAAKKLRGVK